VAPCIMLVFPVMLATTRSGGEVRAELRANGNAIARTDDGAVTQIQQRERGDPIAAVGRPKQREQGFILIDLQQSPVCRQVVGGHIISGERHDLADQVL